MLGASEETATNTADPVGALFESLAKCQNQALNCKRSNRLAEAIQQMEQALEWCAGREGDHPAISVEASRVRLNLSAALSEAGRHTEARRAIVDADKALSSVLVWAESCGADDPGTDGIRQEACALRCAALIAEMLEIERDGFSVSNSAASPTAAQDTLPAMQRHQELYAKARELAAVGLTPAHPITSLMKGFRNDSAVCATSSALAGAAPTAFDRSSSLPPLCASRVNGANGGCLPVAHSRKDSRHMQSPASPKTPTIGAPTQPDRLGRASTAPAAARRQRSSQGQAEDPMMDNFKEVTAQIGTRRLSMYGRQSVAGRPTTQGGRGGKIRCDLFANFQRQDKADREARLGLLGDTWQDDTRKRLTRVQRIDRLSGASSHNPELQDLRFTPIGHKLVVKTLLKDNQSRSQPTLVKEASGSGESPEVVQLKRLCKAFKDKPGAQKNIMSRKSVAA